MKLKAYAKVNLIMNVLGTRPDGYHEVQTLMQALPLCDVVTLEECPGHVLSPADFEYGEKDLGWKAAALMAETYRPDGKVSGSRPVIEGIRIRIEKHIPAAAGLAGGSADAAAVMIGLARIWGLEDGHARVLGPDDWLLDRLLPLGAKLGSDVPFCIASQLGKTAAIASGTGTELEFVNPVECTVKLFFARHTLEDKTRSVYAELRESDCRPIRGIAALLKAGSIEEKRSLIGNHLQAPAERLMEKAYGPDWNRDIPEDAVLCGAGPTYFTIEQKNCRQGQNCEIAGISRSNL